jgi:hypothetical protein
VVNYTIRADERTSIKFPKIKDFDDDTVKISVFPRDGSENFTVYKNKELTFSPSYANVGNYSIEIILTDDNPNPQSSYYTFGIKVTSPRGPRPGVSKFLNATITEMSEYGELTVTFNNEVNIIPNFTDQAYFNQTLLRIKVYTKPSEEVPPTLVNLTWECLSFTTREMKFQLYFKRPQAISNGVIIKLLCLIKYRGKICCMLISD